MPTLAALLNFPIPRNSLGVIAKEMLDIWPENQRVEILYENCAQIMNLYEAKYGASGEVWTQWETLQVKQHPIADYYEFLQDIQSEMASSATNYGYKDIYAGALILVITAVAVVVVFNRYF